MILSVVLIGFCVLIAWLLYRYPLRRAKTPEEYRRLFPFFCILTGFVLFNALLAYFGMSGLWIAASSAPLTNQSEFVDRANGDGVVLAGQVSRRNPILHDDYVAYIDESYLWSPKPLWIDLRQGEVAISNDRYQATGWPVDARQFSYLRPGQTVVVVGYLEDSVGLLDGERTRTLRADTVYAGAHADFVTRAQLRLVLAGVILAVNLIVAALILIVPLRDCWSGMQLQSPQP